MKKVIYGLFAFILLFVGILNVYADNALVKVTAKGDGNIVLVNDYEELKFDEKNPMDSVIETAQIGFKYKIGAKANDGSKFVKWTLNNKDFSTEEIVTIEVNEDMDLVAIFESLNPTTEDKEEKETEEKTKKDEDNNMILYIGVAVGSFLLAFIIVLFIGKK